MRGLLPSPAVATAVADVIGAAVSPGGVGPVAGVAAVAVDAPGLGLGLALADHVAAGGDVGDGGDGGGVVVDGGGVDGGGGVAVDAGVHHGVGAGHLGEPADGEHGGVGLGVRVGVGGPLAVGGVAVGAEVGAGVDVGGGVADAPEGGVEAGGGVAEGGDQVGVGVGVWLGEGHGGQEEDLQGYNMEEISRSLALKSLGFVSGGYPDCMCTYEELHVGGWFLVGLPEVERCPSAGPRGPFIVGWAWPGKCGRALSIRLRVSGARPPVPPPTPRRRENNSPSLLPRRLEGGMGWVRQPISSLIFAVAGVGFAGFFLLFYHHLLQTDPPGGEEGSPSPLSSNSRVISHEMR